jgi:hypothetical protein
LLHHIEAHFAGDEDVLGGGKLLAQFLEELDAVLAGELVIDDEDADAAEVLNRREGVLGAFETLDDVFVSQERVKGTPDIGIILNDNNSLIWRGTESR